MLDEIVAFIRTLYGTDDFIPLHVPRFEGNEREYVNECIDTTFVSSVGKFVDQFEERIAGFTGARYAVATVNGTAALHIALKLAGVERNDEVITQPLTFVATANAISYLDAVPLFVDVDRDTMGLSPDSLASFLEQETMQKEGECINKSTGRRIRACVPMHTFGHPCRMDRIVEICDRYNVALVEDSAESLGSYYNGRHTGTFGKLGIFSFNGNKTITTGGGGMIVTDDEQLAAEAKHLTTTAKVPHKWEYVHDRTGYNYRMTNINAALGVAQLEQMEEYLLNKRETADAYSEFFNSRDIAFFREPPNAKSNYWLNAVILDTEEERNRFLTHTNENGVMTRPIWRLMNKLDMYRDSPAAALDNAEWLEQRVVNIPSSYRKEAG